VKMSTNYYFGLGLIIFEYMSKNLFWWRKHKEGTLKKVVFVVKLIEVYDNLLEVEIKISKLQEIQ
jgi:hypothetical protein